jgi:hypothetical protein
MSSVVLPSELSVLIHMRCPFHMQPQRRLSVSWHTPVTATLKCFKHSQKLKAAQCKAHPQVIQPNARLILKQFLPTIEAAVPVTDSCPINTIISINNSLQDMHHICSTLPNLAHELDMSTVPKLRQYAGQLGHIFIQAVPAHYRQVPTCCHFPRIYTKATVNTSYTIAATSQSI